VRSRSTTTGLTALLVVASSLMIGTFPANASTTTSVPAASHLRASHVSASTLVLTWQLPANLVVSGALVRTSASRFAPSAPSKGVGLGNVPRPGHKLTVNHLAASTWYSFSVFAHDPHGHFARAASISVRTAKIVRSWKIAPSPKFGADDVACPTTKTCVAVGSVRVGNTAASNTLVERWNGNRWAIEPSDNPTSLHRAELNNVSCPTATTCTAVGDKSDSSVSPLLPYTLVERWNGTRWTIVPSPNPPSGDFASLTDVSCTSATSCVAVGGAFNPGPSLWWTFVERWDGTSWSIMPSPNPAGLSYANLTSVSCPTATSCTAVGNANNGTTISRALVERWDGTSWTIVPTPSPARFPSASLNDVSCPTVTTCIAIGSVSKSDSSAGHLLVERWDGTRWTIATIPHPNVAEAELTGVSCPLATNCTAVGTDWNNFSVQRTLVEHWNGTRWAIAPSPNRTGGSALNDVSCPSTTTCTAVGINRYNGVTLVARYGP